MIGFKEQCVQLRKEGHTLPEIMKITGKAKTSIYEHIKNIPLSLAKLQQIRIASGKHIRQFALLRKGKSSRPFKRFEKWTPEIVSLVAHLLFDGGIYPWRGCMYSNRSDALLRQVEGLMRTIYAFEPVRYQDPVTGVKRISYYNVALGSYMRSKADALLTRVRSLQKNCKQEFVRAFFDDEGCIDYRPEQNRRSIRGFQKDVKTLKIIQLLLKELGISARIVKPNEVVVVGKENLKRFEKDIHFSRGIYVNGNRTNSRWKKHIEKRALLRMAIESYKN